MAERRHHDLVRALFALLVLWLAVPATVLPADTELRRQIEEYNAAGVDHLLAGDTREAAAYFARAVALEESLPESERLDPIARSRLFYNQGVALEGGGELRAACRRYREALELDPGYAPAWKAYERAYEKLPADAKGHTGRELVSTLTAQGNFTKAEDYLGSALLGATDRGGAPFVAPDDVPRELARLLTAQRLEPRAFRRRWLPLLPAPGGERADLGAFDTAARRKLARIAWLYAGEVPVLWSEGDARRAAGPWAEEPDELALFSTLARSVADGYQQAGDASAALPRYALASSTSGDYGAAAYYAALLLENPELDPDGALLRRMVSGLFEEKGSRYASGDWEGIARMHTVLGEIFQAQREWGSESEPASAIFQWRRAIEARERAAGNAGAGAPASAPRLHANLAYAYEESGRTREAAESYVVAAEQYEATGRRTEAAAIVERVGRLDPSALHESQRQRLELVSGDEGATTGRLREIDFEPPGISGRKILSTAELQRLLAADPALSGARLRVVEGVGGAIELSGYAQDPRQLEAAEWLLLSAGGVEAVGTRGVELEASAPPP